MKNRKDHTTQRSLLSRPLPHGVFLCAILLMNAATPGAIRPSPQAITSNLTAASSVSLLRAHAQTQDPDPTTMLKQSARMLRDAASAVSGNERSCYLTWAQFIDCQAERLNRNTRVRCEKPTCDFGNRQLAAMLEMIDTDDEVDEGGAPATGRSESPRNAPHSNYGAPAASSSGSVHTQGYPARSTSPANPQSNATPAPTSRRIAAPVATGGAARPAGNMPSQRPGAQANRENKGVWVTENFRPTCWGSDKLFINTYLTATVVNSKGDPSCRGKFLNITNHSLKHAAFIGVNSEINIELKPREERTIPVAGPANPGDPASTTQVRLIVKYWDGK